MSPTVFSFTPIVAVAVIPLPVAVDEEYRNDAGNLNGGANNNLVPSLVYYYNLFQPRSICPYIQYTQSYVSHALLLPNSSTVRVAVPKSLRSRVTTNSRQKGLRIAPSTTYNTWSCEKDVFARARTHTHTHIYLRVIIYVLYTCTQTRTPHSNFRSRPGNEEILVRIHSLMRTGR